MKELKAFIIVVILTGVVYWGVEPLAHSIMHPAVSPANYDFAKTDLELAKTNITQSEASLKSAEKLNDEGMIHAAKKELEEAKLVYENYESFWNNVSNVDLSKGDSLKGKEIFVDAGCVACHSMQKHGFAMDMDSMSASEAFGVAPPDLSDIGYLYDDKFLAALLLDPPMALKVAHKFDDENPFPMTPFLGAGGEDMNQEVADLVAYFKSIAPKQMSDKDVFVEACVRCHDMKYADIYANGNKESIAHYLGSTPPDLSMMIRSKGKDYLHKFLNDTQKMLPGTAMPRVGLTKQAQEQVVNYMQKTGDSKKEERESFGIYAMIYFLILGIFATLWKRKIWKDLH